MAILKKQEGENLFSSRLKLAIGKRSARSFALQCGLSATVMHQYLAGKSEPTRPAIISIANTAEVNIEWLMTGIGPMRKIMGSELVDRELYDGIIEAVEEFLLEQDINPKPEKKLKAYHYLYDEFRDQLEIDKKKTLNTLRLVFSK